jgi:hypothetical protein
MKFRWQPSLQKVSPWRISNAMIVVRCSQLKKKYCNATLIPTSTAVEPLSEKILLLVLAKSQVVLP